ncbi:VOC family protein [Kaistella sp.]|uniref:VOC family protein n=1 Tax=Kaistella sp. TaxID=2782235 RepID=UPI003C46BE3D
MATVNVYLTFDGECEEAFKFYQSVFGGEIPFMGRFGEMPPQEGMPPISDDVKNRIMHVSLPISAETMLMGSDSMPGMHTITKGNNFSLSVNANSHEEAEDLFNKLSVGGTVTMPLADTFWGAYFGMWTDKFGINWMVNYDDPTKQQH